MRKVTKVMVLLMVVVLVTVCTGISNVMAFYVTDGNGNEVEPNKARITITFHYSDGSSWSESYAPEVDGDITKAIFDDEVSYIKEITLQHRDDNPIVSVSITYPKVTHSADDKSDHVRMYWVGTYSGTIKGIYDGWHNELTGGAAGESGVWSILPGADGRVDWYDFFGKCSPVIDHDKSVQTWESVPGNQNTDETRTFTFNAADGGRQYVYFIEGTTYEKDSVYHSDSKWYTGVRKNYGTHISGVIGIVFNYSISFSVNACPECGKTPSTKQRSVPVYYGSYSAAAVSGIAGAELSGHSFKGWYDRNGIPVYDASGNAVLSYTDASGKVQSSPYWTMNAQGQTVWNIEDNLTVYARCDEDVYTVHYDKGGSCTEQIMPSDSSFIIGTPDKLALGDSVLGSDYTVAFDTRTGSGSTYASVIQPKTGFFKFRSWKIEGTEYGSGAEYIKKNAVKHEVVTAEAQYSNEQIILHSTIMCPRKRLSNGYFKLLING